jgi:ATP-dependent RNA helicase RhlE
MLDMGFIHDVRKVIAAIPRQRQTLFFSATMPPEIRKLADAILVDPVRVSVTPPATTVELIEQSVFMVEKNDKRQLLRHVLEDRGVTRALVFTRTKHGADRVVEFLTKNRIHSAAIHGNKSQGSRERALGQFKDGKVRVLVATDIAARGIDIDGISHVINFDLPNVPETYVHRIGRTARAGASGTAFSFCDAEEREFLADIEKLIRTSVRVVDDQPWHSTSRSRPPQPQGQRQQRRGRDGGGRAGGERSRSARDPHRRPQPERGRRATGHGEATAHAGAQRLAHQTGSARPQAAAPSDGGRVQSRNTSRGRVFKPAPTRG